MISSFISLLAEQKQAPFDPSFLVMMVLIFVMMYFVMIRPEQKRRKALQKKIAELKTGDQIVTAGGIHGKVAQIKDTTILIKVAENCKIEINKAAVATTVEKTSNTNATKPEDKAITTEESTDSTSAS